MKGRLTASERRGREHGSTGSTAEGVTRGCRVTRGCQTFDFTAAVKTTEGVTLRRVLASTRRTAVSVWITRPQRGYSGPLVVMENGRSTSDVKVFPDGIRPEAGQGGGSDDAADYLVESARESVAPTSAKLLRGSSNKFSTERRSGCERDSPCRSNRISKSNVVQLRQIERMKNVVTVRLTQVSKWSTFPSFPIRHRGVSSSIWRHAPDVTSLGSQRETGRRKRHKEGEDFG